MKREDKCLSLELAKQIDAEHKRLGIEAKSEFMHIKDPGGTWYIEEYSKDYPDNETYPAYDTAELGEMLTREYSTVKTASGLAAQMAFGWEHKSRLTARELWEISESITETEARGKMYLWLLQNGYIKEEKP